MTMRSGPATMQWLQCDTQGCNFFSPEIYMCPPMFLPDDRMTHEWRNAGWVYKDGKHFCSECKEKLDPDPCLFCGCEETRLYSCLDMFAVMCGNAPYTGCGASGPISRRSEKHAVELWNTR